MNSLSRPTSNRAPQPRRLWIAPQLTGGLGLLCALSGTSPLAHALTPVTPVAPPPAATKARIAAQYGQLPLSFEVNAGQSAAPVKFLARGPGYNLFLTGTAAVLSLRRDEGRGTRDEKRHSATSSPIPHPSSLAVLRLQPLGANPHPVVSGEQKLPGTSNYFIGNDKSQWHSSIANYGRVRYGGVYRGVDMVYYGNQRQLEYDFVVAPGADAGAIRLGAQGARRVWLTRTGELVLDTGNGRLVQHAPVIYQTLNGQRQRIAGGYRLGAGHRIGFRVGRYDHTRPLVIDPSLTYSTYLGGSGTDVGRGIAVDSSGAAYVTGNTASTNFPITAGAYQTATGGGTDVFVSKLNATGTALSYSTYLGGSGTDSGQGIAVDSSGAAYVTGNTASTNFPTTAGAYQTTNKGGTDVFVSKLNATGASLVYSTYLGGTASDNSNGIAVDSSGAAYVTGATNSTDFPTTAGAYQTAHAADGGGNDAFVSKLNATGASLVYSTYLGGTSSDLGNGIAVDSSGMAYVIGQTASTNFPTTAGAYQTASGGSTDAFISKLDTTLSGAASLVYSTCLGGIASDFGTGIAVDSSGAAYVTGFTNSTNFPTTAGAYQTAHAADGGGNDAFVSKLNATGASLVYSTYLGGTGDDRGNGIAVDSGGAAYVTGQTASTNFPITAGAYQTATAGGTDAFVSKLNATGTALSYSTYLGGSGTDQGRGIAVDSSGAAYVTGNTASTNFPTTAGAYQTTNKGGTDVFVSKLNATGASLVYSTYLGGTASDNSNGIAVDSSGAAYVTGATNSTDFPTTAGAYQTAHAADGGGNDAFVSKLNATGASLVYSTYLGGTGDDRGNGIAVDSGGAAYVTGQTASTNFPITAGAYQTATAGGTDAFVSKLTPPAATYVTLVSFTATRYSHVLWLTWQTGLEVDNLGFNVYREVGGKKVRLNGDWLIAGSAIQTGHNNGYNYAWPDALVPGAKYWLEDVDTNGTHTWHGPITPRVSSGSAGAFRRSPVLGQGN